MAPGGAGAQPSSPASPASPSSPTLPVSPTSTVDRQGYLDKRGGSVVTRYQTRWFELRGRELHYFKNEGGDAKGVVIMSDVSEVKLGESSCDFTLLGQKLRHSYLLKAKSETDRGEWVAALKQAMSAAKQRRKVQDTKLQLPKDTFLVRCCSWNVAEAKPDKFDDTETVQWLLGRNITPTAAWIERDLTKPSLVCVCLQEVDMSASGIAKDAAVEGLNLEKTKENVRAQAWKDYFERLLTREGYVEVSYGHEASVLVQVFARADVKAAIDSGGKTEISMWRGKVLKGLVEAGNKGCICVRVKVDGVAYCFVGSHLAAHPEGNAKRNFMYHTALADTFFEESPKTILEHDYVFWLGDLNYRMKGGYYEKGQQADCVMKALKSNITTAIQKHDQLSEARAASTTDEEKGAFQVFHEAGITFYPSYKLFTDMRPDTKLGKELYNIKTESHHIPSYTDRILYYARHYKPTAVMRMWRPPPMIVRKLADYPDRPRALELSSIIEKAPMLPQEMASVGIVPLDYNDTHVHTDHRQLFGLYAVMPLD